MSNPIFIKRGIFIESSEGYRVKDEDSNKEYIISSGSWELIEKDKFKTGDKVRYINCNQLMPYERQLLNEPDTYCVLVCPHCGLHS